MENILQRIEKIAFNEGLTIIALERVIGASKGVLSRAIANGTDIQSKWIQILVENYPLYSAEWLLTVKGDMLRQSVAAVQCPQIIAASDTAIYTEILAQRDKDFRSLNRTIGQLQERLRILETEVAQLRDAPPLCITHEHVLCPHKGCKGICRIIKIIYTFIPQRT